MLHTHTHNLFTSDRDNFSFLFKGDFERKFVFWVKKKVMIHLENLKETC